MTELISAKEAKKETLKKLMSIVDENKIIELNKRIQEEYSKGLTSFDYEGKLSDSILEALELSGYEVSYYSHSYLISWE